MKEWWLQGWVHHLMDPLYYLANTYIWRKGDCSVEFATWWTPRTTWWILIYEGVVIAVLSSPPDGPTVLPCEYLYMKEGWLQFLVRHLMDPLYYLVNTYIWRSRDCSVEFTTWWTPCTTCGEYLHMKEWWLQGWVHHLMDPLYYLVNTYICRSGDCSVEFTTSRMAWAGITSSGTLKSGTPVNMIIILDSRKRWNNFYIIKYAKKY